MALSSSKDAILVSGSLRKGATVSSPVNEQGQITIDRTARDQLGVRPGMIAYQRVIDGRLEVVFLPAPHQRSLYGALRRRGESPQVVTADQLEEAVAEAIDAEHAQDEAERG